MADDWRERYRNRMSALDMTQADLVRRAGFKHQSHVKRILQGDVDPSLTIAARMARGAL